MFIRLGYGDPPTIAEDKDKIIKIETYGNILHVYPADKEKAAESIRQLEGVISVAVYSQSIDYVRVTCEGSRENIEGIIEKIKGLKI